jgi:hypothetical protein
MSLTTESKKEKDFWEFHEANPKVYRLLVDYARRWRGANPSGTLGIDLIYALLRWDFSVTTTTPNKFKLSNNHKPYYARLIMKNNPNLKGIFVTKKQKFQSTIGKEMGL